MSTTLLHAAHSATNVLADVVPNPAPVDPTGGSGAVSTLIGYVKWGGLIACGLTAAASGGLMALGKLSNRPDTAEKGKTALLWSLGGAGLTAIAIVMVNTVFSATS
jgi:hypothetical protein